MEIQTLYASWNINRTDIRRWNKLLWQSVTKHKGKQTVKVTLNQDLRLRLYQAAAAAAGWEAILDRVLGIFWLPADVKKDFESDLRQCRGPLKHDHSLSHFQRQV